MVHDAMEIDFVIIQYFYRPQTERCIIQVRSSKRGTKFLYAEYFILAVEFGELKQNKCYYAVQGHSRSLMSVPIERPYATSY